MEKEMEFTPDLDKIIKDPGTPGFILRAAIQVKEKGFYTTQDFFTQMSAFEMQELLYYARQMYAHNFQYDSSMPAEYRYMFLSFCVLTHILATGEGEPLLTQSKIVDYVVNLCMIISAETLFRTGKAKDARPRYSLLVTKEELNKALGTPNA